MQIASAMRTAEGEIKSGLFRETRLLAQNKTFSTIFGEEKSSYYSFSIMNESVIG